MQVLNILILLFSFSLLAQDITEVFVPANIRPTQMEVGFQAVEGMENWYFSTFAKENNFSPEQANKNLDKYLEWVRELYGEKKSFPGVVYEIDGRRVAFITDGHHRGFALIKIKERIQKYAQESGDQKAFKAIQNNPIKVKIKVLRDYTKGDWTPENAAKDLLADGINSRGQKRLSRGYFTPETRARFTRENTVYRDRLKEFPNTLDELANNKYRSIVGEAFFQLGIDSDDMIDYVEFVIGERLVEKGFIIDGARYSDLDIKRVTHFLFNDSEMYDFLLNKSFDPDLTTLEDMQSWIEVRRHYFYKKNATQFTEPLSQFPKYRALINDLEKMICPGA